MQEKSQIGSSRVAENAPLSDPSDYAFNHWLKYESNQEHAERVEHCEAEVYPMLVRATAPAKAARDATLAHIRPWRGSPKWERQRANAFAVYDRAAAAAVDLFNRCCDELMQGNDLTEEHYAEWDALMPPKAPGIVPEQKKSTAQGNHSDRAVRYETETAYEGVM